MRWQIRAEERKALDDLLGAARRQARQARRDAVRGAAGLRETVAGGRRPPARHALGDAARSLSGPHRPSLAFSPLAASWTSSSVLQDCAALCAWYSLAGPRAGRLGENSAGSRPEVSTAPSLEEPKVC